MLKTNKLRFFKILEKASKPYEKTYHWMTTDNLNFGGCSPMDLIERGKANRLLEMLKNSKVGSS